ncbi:MAG: DinB family protein [Dehalococcoidia bacterium]
MDVRELVISQFKMAHGILLQVMADVPNEIANKKLAGSEIDTVGSTFAHLVFGEDGIVNGLCLGRPPVFMSGGWAGKTGTDMPSDLRQSHEWASSVQMDVAKFLPYAKAVFANTEEAIAGLSDEDLTKTIQGPMGPSTVLGTISGLALYHATQHSGEISALLGAHGRKGLPF